MAVASVFMTFSIRLGYSMDFECARINGVQWLTNPFWIRISMIITMIWLSVGYNTILFLAGLQGISKEIYESAEIDGASKFRQFFINDPHAKANHFNGHSFSHYQWLG